MKETGLMKEIEQLRAENAMLRCEVQELNKKLESATNGIWEMVSREEFINRAINDKEFVGCKVDVGRCECTDAHDLKLHSFIYNDSDTIYIASRQEA